MGLRPIQVESRQTSFLDRLCRVLGKRNPTMTIFRRQSRLRPLMIHQGNQSRNFRIPTQIRRRVRLACRLFQHASPRNLDPTSLTRDWSRCRLEGVRG